MQFVKNNFITTRYSRTSRGEQTTAVAELISSQTFQIEVFLVEFQVTWGISFVLIFSYIQNIAVKDTVVDYDYQKVSMSHVKIVTK